MIVLKYFNDLLTKRITAFLINGLNITGQKEKIPLLSIVKLLDIEFDFWYFY